MTKPWPELPRRITLNGEEWRIRYLRVSEIKFRDGKDAYAYTDQSINELAVAVGAPSHPFRRKTVLKYLFHELCHAAMAAFKVEEAICEKFGNDLVVELDRAGLLCRPKARKGKRKEK